MKDEQIEIQRVAGDITLMSVKCKTESECEWMPQCKIFGLCLKEQDELSATAYYAALAEKVEYYASVRSTNTGLGAGEWESCLTPSETELLTQLAARGYGTWGKEKRPTAGADLQPRRKEI